MRSSLRSSLLGSIFVIAIACGGNKDSLDPDDPNNDPRIPLLSGTGTADSLIIDAPSTEPVARSYDVAWWEFELQVDGDVAGATAGEVSPSDGTRVSIVFWGHRGDGSPTIKGSFAIDIGAWLGLDEEHDAVDIAHIFVGTEAHFANGGPLDDVETAAVLDAVFAAIQGGSASSAESKSLTPSLHTKGDPVSALLTCVGDKKESLKAALKSVASKFKSCGACAAATIFGENTTEAWKACGSSCAAGLKDVAGSEPVIDLLKCKKVLSVPEVNEDSAVTRPDGMTDGGTCYAQSKDKVKGTYRITDGKGSVSCGDCPTGTVPADSVVGCAPADEDKTLVQVPTSKGSPATPRVISKDACVLVNSTTEGTINGNPVDPTPARKIYRIGNRPWDTLPKNTDASSDTHDLSAKSHSGSTNGSFQINGEPVASRASEPDNGDTVEAAIARGGCSSNAVLGLSQQIAEELARCVKPDMLVKLDGNSRIDVSHVPHPFLMKPAADALARAVAAGGGAKMRINHMFRTVAQQYFISRVGSRPECKIKKWARPGASNHETGIALDINSNATWRSALEGAGFKWLGSGDPMHFDYVGPGSADLRGQDVLAFQRLWNRNHPEDRIGEDGAYGGDTEARIKKSPAAGFAKGPEAGCSAPVATTGKGSREPLKYLTNVTTSEYFPGQGCTTGSDASHSDVNACVKSEAVCAPYWCDLADLRDSACSGSTVKPPVKEPTAAPTEDPTCSELGSFKLTYYYISLESDFTGMAAEPMYDRSGNLLAMAPTAFVKASRMNGTVKTLSGKALNCVGKCPHSPYGCFRQLDSSYPNGQGAAGRNLDPYQSIAVDPTVIALGTRVYAKELDGLALPDGTTHDGWLLADDTGGAIKGKHIDFFVEGKAAYRALDAKTKMTHVTLSPEKCGGE